MKQSFIPVQLLTVQQVQELITNGEDILLDAVAAKSNIDKKNLVVRRLNPVTDLLNGALAPGLGAWNPMRIGDGAVLGHGVEPVVGPNLTTWEVEALAAIAPGAFVEFVPEFTVPDDRGIIVVGVIDLGTRDALTGVPNNTPIVESVRILTGGNAIIDQLNVEELETYLDSDQGVRGYNQTSFPFIDEDQFRIQVSFKRAIDGVAPGVETVRLELLTYVVEKYGKVISKKGGVC